MPNLEGHFPEQQLVGHNSNVPDIYFAVVALLLHHFRRRVEWSTT